MIWYIYRIKEVQFSIKENSIICASAFPPFISLSKIRLQDVIGLI